MAVYSRALNTITARYPELAAVADFAGGAAVQPDREIVTPDQEGRPDFARLTHPMHVHAPSPALLERVPVRPRVFDLLDLDGHSLVGETYQRRRRLLTDLTGAATSEPVRMPGHRIDFHGAVLLNIAATLGPGGGSANGSAPATPPGGAARPG